MVFGVIVDGFPSTLLNGPVYPRHLAFSPVNDNRRRSDDMTVTVRRKLDKSGVTVKIKVLVAEYTGVAVATRIAEDGGLTSAIELIHPDPELTYQVYEEQGNGNVVAEWQNWGRKLRLPLYIRAGDGSLVAYTQHIDGVMVGNANERRMLATDAQRRTRFARRRKPGEKLA
ncbi:MAG TPA: DUF6101 family protein [Pelagibacterium sp.]|uniref:DUF6101 family protein n=1 Tax=Pelagibacterium sp. TaxID=1967288 RepID=UPI002CDF1088|nr:DUF6101 family protein [Pelagibacterium sp.]HWJ89186.1 DUF6101 family protein [Pelagibacterium sp.]